MDKKRFTKTSLIAVSAVALTGLAFATPSVAAPHKAGSVASIQAKGHGHNHGMESGKKKGAKVAPISQNITVTVPDDGGTYKLVVTTVAPTTAAGKSPHEHTRVVAVTGTGSVTVTVPGLHPGNYTADLVKVSSSQELTVAAPAAATAKVTK
ncbi:MAG: hypothetical protein RL197_368 [Actinomycetota bacterium]|jgi:hypothetical protein